MNKLLITFAIGFIAVMLIVNMFGIKLMFSYSQEDKPDMRCVTYTDPEGHFAVVTVSTTKNGYSYYCDGSHEAIQWFVVQHGYKIAGGSSLEVYLTR